MATARGANALLRGKTETTWGTAATGNYSTLPFTSWFGGEAQPLEPSDDILGLGREPNVPTKGDRTVSGDVVVPLDLRDIGFWLRLALGAPVTTGAGPYTHTFTSGSATLPSASLEIAHPEIPAYSMNVGMMANSLRIPMLTSGRPRVTVGLIGKSETVSGSSGAGTPTTRVQTYFSRFQGTIKRETVALASVLDAEMTFNNGLDAGRFIGDNGVIGTLDPALISLNGVIRTRFANLTLYNDAIGSASKALELAYVIDASNKLTLNIPTVWFPLEPRPVSGPGGVDASFNWQASRQSGGGASFNAVLVNDVATYA